MAQAIVTKYIGPTNSRDSRIQVKSWRGTKYYSYDHSANCAHTAAFSEWLQEVNTEMAKEYGSEAPVSGWFKQVAKGDNHCRTGYTFIIK